MSESMVRVDNLWKHFGGTGLMARWRRGVPALQGVSFEMREGELASLVGESGSGKTTIGRCLMGLIRFDEGTVHVNGYDVAKLSRSDEHAFRMGAQMVFQNPYASLNPAFRVRDALTEAVRVHDRNVSREGARAEVERLAQLVQLPAARLSEFPSSLSGGERRRVVFARALATRPRFVVTDEPVSGLDQPIQAQLLDLLRRIHERQRTTMLFISHDLRLVRFLSDRVLVILRGRLVEDAPASVFFSEPAHPYSQQLRLSAFTPDDAFPFAKVHKAPPRDAEGCPFRHRCQQSRDRCTREMPRMVEIEPGHRVACHRWGEERGAP